MERHHHQKSGENDAENKIEGSKLSRQENMQRQAANQPSPTSPASPSHDFSFTISLHSSSTTTPHNSRVPPSFALDLSPADDIFFHGHLLPLHLLSHLPGSPLSSTNYMDGFTLPIRESLEDQKAIKDNGSFCSSNKSNINHESNTKRGSKSKSFSIFGLTRGRKGRQVAGKEDTEKQKKKLRLDVVHVLKRYLRMVQPLMLFRGRREKVRFHGQPYSYSGNLSPRNKADARGRRGEYSAPASMRASPTNSGLLLATTTIAPANDTSTLEELQAAIQAAIAHCKNSIAKEEKLKC